MTQTILIIEDMPFDQQMLAGMVDKLGFKSRICADGQAAIALLKAQHADIDLILLDLNMPGVDGISTLGHCKAHYPNLPVIIVTSSEDADDIAQTSKWGADAFIRKPLEIAVLANSIRGVLIPKA